MIIKIRHFSILILLLLSISCNFSVNRENNPSDIDRAKKINYSFYSLVKNKQFNEASNYFGPDVGYKDGLEIIKKINEIAGNLDTVIFLNGTSEVTSKSNQRAEYYSLNFSVIYHKDTTQEEIVIELLNDSLKINGYHARLSLM